MGDAQLRDGNTMFLCRVAGVAVSQNRALLHRSGVPYILVAMAEFGEQLPDDTG